MYCVFDINSKIHCSGSNSLRPSAARPHVLLRVCSAAPAALSLCGSVHSSTLPSLTHGPSFSPNGRCLVVCSMCLQNLCCVPSHPALWLSEGAVDLLRDAEHARIEQGTVWFPRSSSQSGKPLLRGSVDLLSGSLSLHQFVLGKNKRELCHLGHEALK